MTNYTRKNFFCLQIMMQLFFNLKTVVIKGYTLYTHANIEYYINAHPVYNYVVLQLFTTLQ